MNLNKVILIGRLTNDPDLRSTPSGQSVATLSLATNRVWYDQNRQKKEETEFHSIVVWGKQAELANQFLKKGALAYIEGRLRTRSWTDNSGNKRKVTEIVAERIQFGPRTQSQGPHTNEPQKGSQSETDRQSTMEEIPTIDLSDEIKSEELPF